MHSHIIMSHNLATKIKLKLTSRKICTQSAFPRDNSSKIAISILTPWAMHKPSLFLHPDLVSICKCVREVICTGSVGFAFDISYKCGAAPARRNIICWCDCSFLEPSLIWLLSAREFLCGICNFLGTLSRVSIGSPNVVSADAAASSLACSGTTAGTLHLAKLYLFFLSPK